MEGPGFFLVNHDRPVSEEVHDHATLCGLDGAVPPRLGLPQAAPAEVAA